MKTADLPSFFPGFVTPGGGFQAPHLAPGGDQLLRHAAVAVAQGTVAVAAYGNVPTREWWLFYG